MKWLFVLLLSVIYTAGITQQYVISDVNSSINFSIKNFGFTVNGTLSGLKGSAVFNPASLNNANINASVDANTINTNNSYRDSDLKKSKFLDVSNHPLLEIHSTSITATDDKNTFAFTGVLTVKGISKQISFPFTAIATAEGYTFSGKLIINRKDFNIGGGMTMSDEIKVNITVAAKKM